MTDWEHLNRLNKNNLIRLHKNNLQRFFNSVPSNNRWDNLHERLRNVLNIKRKPEKILKMDKSRHEINVRKNQEGKVNAQEAAFSRSQIRLINLELAIRKKQQQRAAEKALSYGAMSRIRNKRKTRNFIREELSLFPRNIVTGLLRPSQIKSRYLESL